MEYCCHDWAGAPRCYLQLLDKLQKQICRTVGPSASLSLFYRYYFGRCSSEMAQLVPLRYCHDWAGAPSCYLQLLDKLQKQICRTVGPSASLSLFCRYYFGRCSSEMAQLVPLPYSRGRSTCYYDRLHDFSVTIPRCYMDLNNFFSHTVRLWNSMPIECFPLNCDLNGFKSRINKHLLTVGLF